MIQQLSLVMMLIPDSWPDPYEQTTQIHTPNIEEDMEWCLSNLDTDLEEFERTKMSTLTIDEDTDQRSVELWTVTMINQGTHTNNKAI